MKNRLKFPALLALTLLTVSSCWLTSCVAAAPPALVGRPYPPRPVYRPYYRPAPGVVVPARRPVIVAPAPRPYYRYRPHRYVRVR
ncbi:hypothetical protein [Hymenobacter rubripertinctus]|uniref:Virulence factor n=1 Tax=Hymenobacter rubripertinctus TaxID=2029981 RepID=A0A418QKJ9_9BACT|nr:hypothetical protein [Hymenobacter rubripertinctus]RIY05630.1 hypothetical protein D0T11_20145 [Hymenobacter rubripertinctus]